MSHLVVDEKAIRKRMIDLEIKTISELSINSGVSKPTIYGYINGKTPLSDAFVRLCAYLGVEPKDVLMEVDDNLEESHD
ncbi:MAG: helix-turn-helix domain-containing protein [Clostridiales bacterium]|nr:helix-turn-helix domain-containing protein [Clostridiales bacterium]